MRQSRQVAASAVLSWLWLALFYTSTLSLVEAAHSRRRVVARGTASPRYDRSITTFDQSGRLLQVEYGMEAASRGETVLAVWTEGGIYVVVKTQQLISSSSSHKVHRIDEHLWLFTAGLSGDARALTSSLRSSCQQHRLSYGEASTVEQAARHTASLQHQLTRTGGARPLGCTAIVVGIDPTASGGAGSSRVFRTDPGGILEDCLWTVAGKDHDKLMTEMARRYDGFSKTANETAVITEMLSAMSSLAGSDDDSSVDIWMFKPDAKRRGKTHATCLRNVKSDDLQDVVSLLDKRENI
jgi:20S proteasome alpha/beta subunit